MTHVPEASSPSSHHRNGNRPRDDGEIDADALTERGDLHDRHPATGKRMTMPPQGRDGVRKALLRRALCVRERQHDGAENGLWEQFGSE